jgi:two-component sensor histidine kinase
MTRDYELQERIRNDLKEKEVLLQEVHHRVKNNLQIISSLLNMQADGSEDPQIRRLFEDSRRRVFSMALIHNQLYQNGNLAEIDFKEYTQMLFGELLTVTGRANDIHYTLDMNEMHLPLQKAIPCGLILNELITNSLKHAFTEKKSGEINISLQVSEDEQSFILCYQDNGCGMNSHNDSSDSHSLGLSLIENLTEQLQGSLEVLSADEGVSYCITFPRV